MKKIIGVLFLLSLVSVACEDSSRSINANTYLLKPKIGIFPENHFGITSIGYGQLKANKPSTVITFSIPTNSEVTVWIVPITTNGDESGGYTNFGGSSLVEIESAQSVYFVQEIFEAGSHSLEWNLDDNPDQYVPGGWYRIYVVSPDFFDYRDVFLWLSDYDRP